MAAEPSEESSLSIGFEFRIDTLHPNTWRISKGKARANFCTLQYARDLQGVSASGALVALSRAGARAASAAGAGERSRLPQTSRASLPALHNVPGEVSNVFQINEKLRSELFASRAFLSVSSSRLQCALCSRR